jgi:hypothetical protein
VQQQTQPQPPPGSVAGYNSTTTPQTVNAKALPQHQTQVQGSPSASTVGVSGKPRLVGHFSSYAKSSPGKSIAIAGGLGLVTEACGVNVLSDAVAGSRVYANIQNAKQRKKPQSTIPNSIQHTAPTAIQNGNVAGAYQVMQWVVHPQHQGTHVAQNHSVAQHTINRGHFNSQQMHSQQQPFAHKSSQQTSQQQDPQQMYPMQQDPSLQYYQPQVQSQAQDPSQMF